MHLIYMNTRKLLHMTVYKYLLLITSWPAIYWSRCRNDDDNDNDDDNQDDESGLKITAGHRTMSGQDDYLSGQNLQLQI